jgi:hypothetical protein
VLIFLLAGAPKIRRPNMGQPIKNTKALTAATVLTRG